LTWFPRSVRDAGTDLLRFQWEAGKVLRPIVPKLKDALHKTGSAEILDLGSGGGGPVLAVRKQLRASGYPVRVTLTDKFPNLAAFRHAKGQSDGDVSYQETPVDATAVPPHLAGFRTLFATAHHFHPHTLQHILKDAVDQRRPIGIFDYTARALPPPAVALIGNPFFILVAAPFLRPFRWSRLFWTYVFPVGPIFFTWDAFVSGLRLYSTQELREIVDSLPPNNYLWGIGSEPFPRSITYLIGYPES
jgi:hypothetical protein